MRTRIIKISYYRVEYFTLDITAFLHLRNMRPNTFNFRRPLQKDKEKKAQSVSTTVGSLHSGKSTLSIYLHTYSILRSFQIFPNWLLFRSLPLSPPRLFLLSNRHRYLGPHPFVLSQHQSHPSRSNRPQPWVCSL
jgi:hypothetical protein